MAKPLAVSNAHEAATVSAEKGCPRVYFQSDVRTTHRTIKQPATHLRVLSHEQMLHWIATIDAELTFVGKPINPLAPRSARTTMLSYCSNVNVTTNTCSGPCSVYNGGPLCINTPNRNCLAATTNSGSAATLDASTTAMALHQ